MKKKVSRPAEKSSSPKQKKSLLGNILQAIVKPSTGEKPSTAEKVSTVDEKPSTGEKVSVSDGKPSAVKKVSDGDEKSSAAEKVSVSDKKSSAAEKVSDGDKKPSAAEKVSTVDEKPSAGEKVSVGDKKPSAVEKVSTVDEKPSTGEKVSDGDEKSLASKKVSDGDEKSLAGEKISHASAKSPVLKFSNIDDTTSSLQQKDLQSLGTFSAPENILMPDDKPSPQKISTPEIKTSSSQKISTPEVKTPSPQKISTPEVKPSSQKISQSEVKPSPEKVSASNKVEEYTITIKGGTRDRVIKLSSKMFRLGTASIIVGGILLLATSAWSFYSSLRMQRDAATIREVEQAAELRQEQLLTLSKKAAALDETIQNLTRQEEELRIQAGLNPIKDEAETSPADQNQTPPAENSSETPPTENPASTETPAENSSDENNGQGGPVGELTVAEVSEALDMLEAKVDRRRKSLDEFQTELKQRREQMAAGARVASGYTPGSSTSFVPGGGVEFDFSNGLPIIPAAGSIPAPGSFPFDPSLVGGNGAADSHIPSIWPTTGVVTSPYGLRWGGTDFHPGMDIANDMGTPIVATADGVVDYAGWNSGGYGNMVDIDHGNGIMTRYGHASQVVVSAGQHVKRGQLIAYMGSTGFSTGPHVHYEVHVNGNRVNPISYL